MVVRKEKANLYVLSGALVLFLSLIVLLVLARIDFEKINIFNLLVGVTFFCILVVTVTVFQSFKISESAEVIAENMTKGVMESSRELFLELYKKSPVPYILINHEGLIETTNISARRLFSVMSTQLEKKNIFDLIQVEDIHHVSIFLGKLQQGISITDEEAQILLPDGTIKWVLCSLFPYRDPDNFLKGLLTLVDITKQKEIDTAKSEFVSLASHQLRTPIVAMKWNLELFRAKTDEFLNPSQKKYITKIENNLSRMDLLVKDFLNVSKIELGTFVSEEAIIDLDMFIKEIMDEHSSAAEGKNITMKKQAGLKSVTVKTDPHLLRMIINNIISNALKYTLNGGEVVVRVSVNNKKLSLIISDTGIGIPADEQDMIFTKIFRASNALTKVPSGTGLGLYIAHQAVEMLGGTISFVSQVDVGTTFTVFLPRTVKESILEEIK